MKLIRSILEEIVGLFVDDWRFAFLLVAWIAAGRLAALEIPAVAGLVFFVGLAGILLGFVYVKATGR